MGKQTINSNLSFCFNTTHTKTPYDIFDVIVLLKNLHQVCTKLKIKQKENPENRKGFGVFDVLEIIQIISLRTEEHDERP